MRRIGLAGSLLLTATGLLAQATGTTTADLRGVVVDETGSALPGASITATNQDNGFSRQATSDAGGSFAIRLLPPGLYRVSASLPGLRAADVPNVRLSVGTTTTLELRLEPSAVAESVTVTAETPLIDTSSTELSKTIDEAKIRNLPINQRNVLEFALTTPGVTVGRGPQVGAFPTSGLSINGQSPRYNNILVDGVDNNDSVVGSVRSTISQEAVREYQVIQSSYPAEYGKATGGIINVVTRSGSNAWHGSAFAFFRDESLSADNFLSGTRTPFQQNQYGASLSGPILRDRLFFFAVAERLTVADANVVTISDDDVTMIRAAGFDIQNGVVPFDRNADSLFGRLDFLPSPSHTFSLRGTYARSLDENQQAWGGLVARSSGGVRNLEDGSVGLTGTSILTASLSNELRALYADRSQRLDSLDPNRSPQVTIVGVATFGTQPLLPNPRDTQVYQIFDAISWFGGRSSYKAGFDYTHTTFAGSVPANFAGSYVFDLWPAGALRKRRLRPVTPVSSARVSAIRTGKGRRACSALSCRESGTSRTACSCGWACATTTRSRPIPSRATRTTGRRGSRSPGRARDTWRVRGGLGRFYGAAAIVPMFAIAVNNGIQTVYVGRILGPPGQSPSEPWNLPDHRFPDPTSAGADRVPQPVVRPAGCENAMPPDLDLEACAQFESAYTDQANLGFEIQIGPRLRLQRRLPVRPRQKHPRVAQHQPSDRRGTSTESRAFASIYLDSASGNSWYNGVTVGLQTRTGGPFEMSAFYTYADAQDDYIDWLTPIQLQDPLNPQDERGPSIHVPRHRATLTAIYTTVGRALPWYARDWNLATIAAFEAGRPFNVIAGYDRNGMAIRFPTARRESRATADSSRTPSTWTCGSRARSRSAPWLSKRRSRCSTSSTARTCSESTMSATWTRPTRRIPISETPNDRRRPPPHPVRAESLVLGGSRSATESPGTARSSPWARPPIRCSRRRTRRHSAASRRACARSIRGRR